MKKYKKLSLWLLVMALLITTVPLQSFAWSNVTPRPEVSPVVAGDTVVRGWTEHGTQILLYDENGYHLKTDWGFDGTFKIEIGRKAKAGEILQVYAHSGPREKSEPVKVIVGGSSYETSIPSIQNMYQGDTTIRGSSEPYATLEFYDERGYSLGNSIKADSTGAFRFSVRSLVHGELIQVYATAPNKVKTSIPARVRVGEGRTEADKDAYLSLDRMQGGDTTLSGRTYPYYYLEARDSQGILLGSERSDGNGNFRISLQRNLRNGELLTIKVYRDNSSYGFEQRVTVENIDASSMPTVEELAAGTSIVKGTGIPAATITVYDTNSRVIGKGIVEINGSYAVTLQKALVMNEQIYITATELGKGESSKVSIRVSNKEKTEKPEVDVVGAQKDTITGKTVSYGKIIVKDSNNYTLGENWAGSTGRFTITLNRRTVAGETLYVQAQGDNKLLSETTVIVVEKVIESESLYGYIDGYLDGSFKPSGNLTRAEAAVMFARLLEGDHTVVLEVPFKDANNKWYSKGIADIARRGYLNGYPDGTFKPNNKITRAEFAKMISKYDTENSATAPFYDVKNHWAKEAIDKEYGNGRLDGYPDGSFKPNASITRAEAVKVFNHLFGRKTTSESLVDINLNQIKTFTDVGPSHWAYYEILDASNTHTVDESSQSSSKWVTLNR